jgi:hypothetical protein
MTWRATGFWITALGAIGTVVAIPLAASRRWTADTQAMERRLLAGSPSSTGPFTAGTVGQLPPPVRRYVLHVMREGQPRVSHVQATQIADFFLNGAWRPLTATQEFAIDPVGFVWDARIRMAPLMSAYVRDAYLDGEGSMRATVHGVYTLVDQRGRPELDTGALQRFLAEAVWFPTALLPGGGVTWEPLSDRSALATLTDAETSVSLEFRFNERDEISDIVGQRYAESQGRFELREWRVRCGDYRERHGLLIPVTCEVSWMTPSGPAPYWRGTIDQISYTFAH